jgi:hypothetical protein
MTHLREVLGDETYESLANAGGNMTTGDRHDDSNCGEADSD